jgi:hypothetical protein
VDGVADITAGELTLRVSGAGSDIGAGAGNPLEINADTLSGTTGGAAGDDIFVLDTDGGVAIDSLDAGLGNIHLTAMNGSITSAAPGAAADVVGSLVDLEIVGAGNIGVGAADPLRIDAAVLNADASAGGGGGGDIFITDVQGGVAVGLATAGAGDVVLRAEDGSITSQTVDAAADIVGNRVELSATGNARTIGASAGSRLDLNAAELHASTEDGAIFLADTDGGVTVGVIDAGGQDVHLSATGGSIADDGNDATAITAGGLFLDVGAAHGIGAIDGTGAIDTDVNSLTASAGTGGIFVQEGSGITLSAVTAQGEVRVTALAGNIAVNTVTTAGDRRVRLAAPAGAITDGNGAATNVTGGHLRFTAQGQINLDTAASILTAASDSGNVNLRETDGATLRSLTADGGDVTITTATGDLEVEEIDADGTATLTATAGSILDDGDDATEIVGGEIVLSSGPAGSVGAAGTLPDIDTRGGTIVASAGSGGAFITEADGADVTANVTGAGPLRLRNGEGTLLVIAGASGTEDGDVSIDTDGVIRISAPLTSGGGDISLDADGVTDVRSIVRTSDGNITFGANRAGQVSLRADVSAPGDGTVTFNQAVSVDDDARVRAGRSILFGSAIDGDSALTLDGDADTDVTLSEAVGADTPLASLTIDGRNINLREVTVDGNIAINSVPQVVGGLPEGLITLDGDVRSIAGDVSLNAVGRADVPTVATIAAPGDVTVTAGGDVRMGRNEKLTAIGDLTIDAGGDAFLGDLTALNTLAIEARDIRLLLRSPGGVRSPNGGIEQDDGLDLIGGDGIELEFRGRNIIFDGVGAAPRFASNNGIGLDRQDLAGLQTFALTTAVSAATLSDGAITLDGRVDGRIFAIVPVIAPKEARQAQLEAGVGAGMLTDLAEIGVNVRTLELDQLIEFLERLVVYDDVPPEMAAVPRGDIEPNRYRITRNRISFRAASQVVETYRRVFFTQPPAGADGPAKPVLRTREMGQRIDDAIADYRSKTPDAFEPLAFRRFVEETPAHAEALSYLNGIRELFVMIQPVNESEAGGGLGLTPAEAAISRQVILSKLEISGAEPQDLEAAIFGVAPAPAEQQK